jgi:hypothetical protein
MALHWLFHPHRAVLFHLISRDSIQGISAVGTLRQTIRQTMWVRNTGAKLALDSTEATINFFLSNSQRPPGGFWGPGSAAPGQGAGQSALRANGILPAPPRAVLWARAKIHCLGGVC